MKRTFLAIFILSAGCAHGPAPGAGRFPASVLNGAGMTDTQSDLCSEADCQNLVAPCTLKSYLPENQEPGAPAPTRPLTMMEERYLDQFTRLKEAGYCELPPHALPAETYNANTCLFVFVKRGDCSRR